MFSADWFAEDRPGGNFPDHGAFWTCHRQIFIVSQMVIRVFGGTVASFWLPGPPGPSQELR